MVRCRDVAMMQFIKDAFHFYSRTSRIRCDVQFWVDQVWRELLQAVYDHEAVDGCLEGVSDRGQQSGGCGLRRRTELCTQ